MARGIPGDRQGHERGGGARDSPRARLAAALRPAREAGYGAGEYVGQENFMSAGEILALARDTGVTARALTLDLCCGTGGPSRYLARQTGCRIVGVDRDPDAIRLARALADGAGADRGAFLMADAGRLPFAARFDAALLLETMLAIEDKARLLTEVRRLLRPGGRFGLTLEEGRPLTDEERRRLPEGDAVWLVTEAEFLVLLEGAGFRVRQVEDHTAAHAALARRLGDAFGGDRDAIAAAVGRARYGEIITAHRQWVAWLAARRVRKLAIVAEPGR
ncbi:MAG: methyltransferase domain-containing protein [Chloroflexota bacterium]|nr:methyltransferase domain-containing protein [Chloroflexota bacterium]